MADTVEKELMRGLSEGGTVLVTGATGFIGRRLAERLVTEGHRVRLLVRGSDKVAPELRRAAEIVVGDLADLDALRRAVQGASVIFHCAANVNTWDRWEAYYATNVAGVRNLLDAVVAEKVAVTRLVHVSTVDVYGFPLEPCDERRQPVPGGFGYGESKWLGESIVSEQCAAAGIPYTIIRPCNVIGPGSQFIERIGAELKSGLMLKVDGGRANAGLVYVDNLVDHLLWAACSDKARGQCYNVRDDYDVTWADFIAKLRQGIRGRGIVINLPFWLSDVAARVIEAVWRLLLPSREPLLHRLLVRIFGRTCGHDAAKIRRDAALVGQVGFDEAMERSIRWLLSAKSPR